MMRHIEEKANRAGPPATFALKFPLTFSAPTSDTEHGAIDEVEPNPQEKENSK